MKVLVTGGAGFIGSHLVDALRRQGEQTVAVDNLSTGSLENLDPECKFYKVDIRDRESLHHVFDQEKPDVVCHHAAQMDVRKSMRDPGFDADVNILGSLNVVTLSLDHRVRKLIFASTSAVYADAMRLPAREDDPVQPISAYGIAKHAVEKYLHLYSQTHGLRYVALRYGNVFGPRQNPHGEAGVIAIFTHQLLTGVRPTIFGDGSKTRDYVAVDDVVQATLRAIDNRGDGVYNIGRGTEVSDLEIFEAVRSTLGVRVQPYFAPLRAGELSRICLDCRRAEIELAWGPKVELSQGITATVEYYVNRSELFCDPHSVPYRHAIA
jgi:UDP-glucose 4-epimerase